MNKQQLIEKIATDTRLPKAQVETIIDCFTHHVTTAVKTGHDVKLMNFGTFVKKKNKARIGRNPRTGQMMKLPAKWVPKFRPHTEFKNKVM